jgi:hypothetical protein
VLIAVGPFALQLWHQTWNPRGVPYIAPHGPSQKGQLRAIVSGTPPAKRPRASRFTGAP